ncbi:hypothetical protein LRR81_08740 [Metabacillus sp. GX 13764]|uniref:hypothetical protein n=1 Tax=Metabacillus kandeliae TaxID=2900151 RepID=UPI001E5F9586|nr:hypothetical protein [Metabacillus kandeliae]MCD7034320.1 hypothetical protein [Metabacillus kandeliae]
MTDKLVRLLQEKHGKDLNLKENVYYLFLKGGLFALYYDEDEKTVKVDIDFLPEANTFVYFDEQELEALI